MKKMIIIIMLLISNIINAQQQIYTFHVETTYTCSNVMERINYFDKIKTIIVEEGWAVKIIYKDNAELNNETYIINNKWYNDYGFLQYDFIIDKRYGEFGNLVFDANHSILYLTRKFNSNNLDQTVKPMFICMDLYNVNISQK